MAIHGRLFKRTVPAVVKEQKTFPLQKTVMNPDQGEEIVECKKRR
jgi:hypothetical protein